MVLDGVGEAVEEEIYTEEGEAVEAGTLEVVVVFLGFASGLGRVVKCEQRDAAGDGQDDQVF